MMEITRTVSGIAKHLTGISDVIEVLTWALAQTDLYFTVAARVDGTLLLEAGGVKTDTVTFELGQWLVFDGDKFSALSDEDYQAAGYQQA